MQSMQKIIANNSTKDFDIYAKSWMDGFNNVDFRWKLMLADFQKTQKWSKKIENVRKYWKIKNAKYAEKFWCLRVNLNK